MAGSDVLGLLLWNWWYGVRGILVESMVHDS